MNTTHLHDERSIKLCIIISLLLHMILALYISTRNFTQQLPLSVIDQKETNHEKIMHKTEPEWVETKTRSSYASAPVFFQEHQAPMDEHSSDHDATCTDSAKQENINDLIDPIDNDEQKCTDKVATKQETQIDTQLTSIAATTPRSPSKLSQIKPTVLSPVQIAKPSMLSHTPQKSLPSLSQLTQGMLSYMQENGKHSVSMLGKKHGTPTDEQLKYERYLERLNQCLHNSFVINTHKQPHYSFTDLAVTVYLALNKDGTIYNLKLVKTSGETSIDLFVMSVLRDASSSFPPVPHYLPHNPFAIHYVINFGPSYHHR